MSKEWEQVKATGRVITSVPLEVLSISTGTFSSPTVRVRIAGHQEATLRVGDVLSVNGEITVDTARDRITVQDALKRIKEELE